MANELSRVSDRLTRARERSGNGAAGVWLPPPARREPTRRELHPEPREASRAPTPQSNGQRDTWVAIHVQLRHQHDPAPNVIYVPGEVDAAQDYIDAPEDDVDAPALEKLEPERPELPARKALPAHAAEAVSDAFFVPKALASHTTPASKYGVLHYLASRALNAYLTQSTFASPLASEPRMLDVHA